MNRKGQITLLVIFPLLLIVVATIVASSAIIAAFAKSEKICRTQMLKAQEIQAKALANLLGLNPMARALRRAKHVSAQLALDRLQKTIIQSGNLKSNLELKKIIDDLHSWIQTEFIKLPTLKVVPIQKFEIAPEYVVGHNFKVNQESTIKLKLLIKKLLPDWLLHLFSSYSDVNINCAATLIQRGEQWIPTLTMGK